MRIAVIDDLKSDRQLLISRLNKLLSDNSINGEIYEFEKGIDAETSLRRAITNYRKELES